MKKRGKLILLLFAILIFGLLLDLYLPLKKNFRDFDPVAVGHLDQKMWRSYYEKKPIVLFYQLASLMRKHFHAPFVRSYLMAYYSARAAFIFKEGTNRQEYKNALPDLNRYFSALNKLSEIPFSINEMSELELEWWIIRRERDLHPPSEWSEILAKEASLMYSVPAENFKPYADKRVEAMLLRDEKGVSISAMDWATIDHMCVDAWKLMKKEL